MIDPVEAQVLVVGGGPVGLTLAMDLAQRGIRTVVAELRHKGEPPSVKCNHVSARSMEIFRRLGVAKAIRNAGLPADYPNDVSYRVSFTGKELSRIPIPCRRDRYTASGGPDTWWPTAEPAAPNQSDLPRTDAVGIRRDDPRPHAAQSRRDHRLRTNGRRRDRARHPDRSPP